MHELNLKPIYFNLIKNGQKIYEIRLNDEKRQKIDAGDLIIFKNSENPEIKMECIVKDLIYFNTFGELINTLPLDKVGFKGKTKEEVEKVYYSFYTKEAEKEYGVVAIKVELL